MHLRNTPIIIDEFRHIPGCYIYLLSHMHTDHTSGLNPSWNNGTIYCTHSTRALLLYKFKVKQELVIGLNEDECHQISLDSKVTMQVTLIDANHCPGACMFLLDGYFGRVFCTGDFRFDPVMLQHHALRNVSGTIDDLYMDDTFLDPAYDFPSRKQAGEQIVNIVKNFGEETKFLVGSDHLGREELLVAIGLALKSLVVVDRERLESLNVLRRHIPLLPDIFTDHVNLGRVIVLPKKQVNYKTVQRYRQEVGPTIGICPSGWSAHSLSKTEKYKTNWIYRVAYSLHSSFPELVQFVQFLKPKNLYSTSNHDNVTLRNYLGQYCQNSENSERIIEIPRSVRMAMEKNRHVFQASSSTSSSIGNGGTIMRQPCLQKCFRKRKRAKGLHIRETIEIKDPSTKAPVTVDVSSSDDDEDNEDSVLELEAYPLECLLQEAENEPSSPRDSSSADNIHSVIQHLQTLADESSLLKLDESSSEEEDGVEIIDKEVKISDSPSVSFCNSTPTPPSKSSICLTGSSSKSNNTANSEKRKRQEYYPMMKRRNTPNSSKQSSLLNPFSDQPSSLNSTSQASPMTSPFIDLSKIQLSDEIDDDIEIISPSRTIPLFQQFETTHTNKQSTEQPVQTRTPNTPTKSSSKLPFSSPKHWTTRSSIVSSLVVSHTLANKNQNYFVID